MRIGFFDVGLQDPGRDEAARSDGHDQVGVESRGRDPVGQGLHAQVDVLVGEEVLALDVLVQPLHRTIEGKRTRCKRCAAGARHAGRRPLSVPSAGRSPARR